MYFAFDNSSKAEAFESVLKRADEEQEKAKKAGVRGCYDLWLGYVSVVCGVPYHRDEEGYAILGIEGAPTPDYSVRGEITYYELVDSHTVAVDVNTAYEPAFGAFAEALNFIGLPFKDGKFEGVEVSYYAEETSSRLYTASDTDTAEGDCHVYFSMEHEPDGDIPDSVHEEFDSDNSDDDAGEYRSEYTANKTDFLKKIAEAAGTTPDDRNLIEKYETALSDGTVGISFFAGSRFMAEEVRKVFPEAEITDRGSRYFTGDFCEEHEKIFERLHKKYPKVETIREGLKALQDELKDQGYDVRLYANYGVDLDIVDYQICDWLDWTEGWKPGSEKKTA